MGKRGFDTEPGDFEIATCRNQGHLFAESQYDFDCDAFDFAVKFMNSEIAESMDKDISMCHIWGIKQIGETLIEMVEVKKHTGDKYVNRDCLFWVGYMYRYWAWWLGTGSKDIIKEVPIEKACSMYPGYHTLDVKAAIMMFKRANQQ